MRALGLGWALIMQAELLDEESSLLEAGRATAFSMVASPTAPVKLSYHVLQRLHVRPPATHKEPCAGS